MTRLRSAVGALLIVGGVSTVAVATAAQPSLPAVAALPGALPGSIPALDRTAPPEAAPVMDTPVPAAPTAAPPVLLGASEPVALEIPALGVAAEVSATGLNQDGTIEVPQPGPTYDLPAWYRHSPTPGELGPAVILGHVDHPDGTPSVFAGVGSLQPGDEVRVRRADGSTALFRVTGVANYPKAAFPTVLVYGDLDHAGLRLITCSGGIDAGSGHYRDNTVVFAAAAHS